MPAGPCEPALACPGMKRFCPRMSLKAIPLEEITEAQLEFLVKAAARESRVLDYKREWRAQSASDQKELLLDFTSFANDEGGDIVYGVEEAEGAPVKIVGLQGF